MKSRGTKIKERGEHFLVKKRVRHYVRMCAFDMQMRLMIKRAKYRSRFTCDPGIKVSIQEL